MGPTDWQFPECFAGQDGPLRRLGARHAGRGQPEPMAEEGSREELLAVRAAIRRLPARHGTVLVLRYHQDLPQQEVARVLGIPVGTSSRPPAGTRRACAATWRGGLRAGGGELRPAAAASASSGYRAVTAVVPAT